MRQWIWIAVLVLTCTFAARASDDGGAVRRSAEASMLLTGTIEIAPDGSVAGHALDHPESLSAGTIRMLGGQIPAWRFQPIIMDGVAVRVRARMSLLLVAKALADGSYGVEIRSAYFGNSGDADDESLTAASMKPPKYPLDLLIADITGTVYLVVHVGQQGKVDDVAVEQVNLRFIGTATQMREAREALALAASRAARRWTFNPPTAGDEAGKPSWHVRVPVDFVIGGPSQVKYGEWEAYVPGPRQTVPWLPVSDASEGPDALVAGTIYPVGKGLRLLTPLKQG